MAINKSQKRLLYVLSVVVLYAAYDLWTNMSDYQNVYSGKKGTTVTVKSNKEISIQTHESEKRIEKVEFGWNRDPFFRNDIVVPVKKPVYRPKPKPLKLQAITYSPPNSYVIINDLILKSGEMVQGYRVTEINKNHVKLTKDGKSIVLSSD